MNYGAVYNLHLRGEITMVILGYEITPDLVISSIVHILGFWLLYKNRQDLLYDNEDNDPTTPYTLSLGRCWSWLLFYIAFSYWLRYLMGMIPPSTPFPPGLQEMLYACLLYEFAKKGVDVSKILLRGKLGGGWPTTMNGGNGTSYGYPSDTSPVNDKPQLDKSRPVLKESVREESSMEPPSDYKPAKGYSDTENLPNMQGDKR